MALALLFDLDGTLMDTLGTIVEAMNAAADDLGVSPSFRADELRPTIGMPVQRELQMLRGIVGPIADEFTDRYYAHFTHAVDRGVRLYPEVMETFPAVASRPIGSMSTRRAYQVDHMLRVTGLRGYFRAVVGGDEVSRPKPFPDLPLLGARALRVSAQDCVVVGDSPVDIRAGRSAGMKTVAVLYGYGDSAAVAEAGPDAVIRRFSELPSVVAALERG
ncbi:MAG TPA: HAD-IA family hydrolase [Thermoplasmata archaeon]